MTRDISETHGQLLRGPKVAATRLREALQEGNAAVIQMALRDIVEAQEDGGGQFSTDLFYQTRSGAWAETES